MAAQHQEGREHARQDSVLALIVVGSAAILRVSVALGVCAALINLLVWNQPIMEMANGHTYAFKVLYAVYLRGALRPERSRASPSRRCGVEAPVVCPLLWRSSLVSSSRQLSASCCIAVSPTQNLCTTQ